MIFVTICGRNYNQLGITARLNSGTHAFPGTPAAARASAAFCSLSISCKLDVLALALRRVLLRRPLSVDDAAAASASRSRDGPAREEGALAERAFAKFGTEASNSDAGMPVAAAKAASTPDSLLEAVPEVASGLPRDLSSAANALITRGLR